MAPGGVSPRTALPAVPSIPNCSLSADSLGPPLVTASTHTDAPWYREVRITASSTLSTEGESSGVRHHRTAPPAAPVAHPLPHRTASGQGSPRLRGRLADTPRPPGPSRPVLLPAVSPAR